MLEKLLLWIMALLAVLLGLYFAYKWIKEWVHQLSVRFGYQYHRRGGKRVLYALVNLLTDVLQIAIGLIEWVWDFWDNFWKQPDPPSNPTNGGVV